MNAINNYPEGLQPEIIEELNRTNVNSIKRRLARDLFDLQNKGAYIYVEYNYENDISSNKNNNNIHLFTINIILSENDDLITVQICRDYPFRPPKNITINYKCYKRLLIINSQKTVNEVKSLYYDFNKQKMLDCCLACSSITCHERWSPGVRLSNIVQEIKNNKKLRRAVIDTLLASKILNRYLTDDKGFHKYFYSFLFHF
jgi:ubiquitin-protein ligase